MRQVGAYWIDRLAEGRVKSAFVQGREGDARIPLAPVPRALPWSRAIVVGLLALGSALTEAQDLQTWGHENEEMNATTDVAAGNVRRSTVYNIRVATSAAPDALQDSFTYMSVPRSGRPKEGYSDEDGADFPAQAGMTMSWSSFLYRAETWVHIEIREGPDLTSADQVKIRPTTLNLQKELVNPRTVRILVPYSPVGFRFSVEFDSQQLTTYLDSSGEPTTNPAASPVVHTVHTEPRHAMMIFAEPMLEGADVDRLVPNPASHAIYYPAEGQVTNLHDVTEEVIYFRPGTYYMSSSYHATLRPGVRWVYLAPGAYVKGAFQFVGGPTQFKVTGPGALSGEQYVYEPDRSNGYRHRAEGNRNCHNTCVKMLEFEAQLKPQQLELHGITIANPPYHSMVVYGHERQFAVHSSRIKQVGAWYWQTDGPELYEGSSLENSFLHANDDVLKLYASDVNVANVVVWKGDNGPVFQWGWIPRDVTGVRVNGVDVIHNRMHRSSHNSCILNSARHYRDTDSDRLADPGKRVMDMSFQNVRSEGANLCAMRLYALSSWESIRVENLWIEQWNELDLRTQASEFKALSDADGRRVFIGNEIRDHRGVALVNYFVGAEHITKAADNWRHDRMGRLDFDPALWENWDAR